MDTSNIEQKYLLTFNNRRWQISELMKNIIIIVDGEKNIEEITKELNSSMEINLLTEDVFKIIENLLKNNDLLENMSPDRPLENTSKNKHMWFKVPIIKGSAVKRFKFLSIFYNKTLLIILLSLSLMLQIYSYANLITFSNYYEIMKLNSPNFIYIMLLLNLGTICHEFGHMAAFMKHDLEPGNIGFAFYLTMPVLYSDVSNSWGLTRKQRFLIDVGGIYFNNIYNFLLCILGLLLHNSTFIFASFVIFVSNIGNFNPFLKMDGYWAVSDLLGIPNLHNQMRNWISSKFYGFFHINTTCNIETIRTREKKAFYVYSVFGLLYIFFFVYSMILLFINSFNKLIILKAALKSILMKNVSMLKVLMLIAENFGTLLIVILIARMIIVSGKNLIKVKNVLTKILKESPKFTSLNNSAKKT